MNKKLVTLILVILISFCFLSIVVADNVTHNNSNTADHGKKVNNVDKVKKVDGDKNVDKNKTADKNKTTDKNKTDDKSKKNYILAKGNGNNILFSDGFRGFILDYSKSPASSGDEFKRVSASAASNSNTLKLAIIECYKQGSSGQIVKIMGDFVKTGSSSSKVGEAVAASHEAVGDHAVVKINKHTEAVFDFEVLKSVSGNESDYFAYKVSYRSINDGENVKQTNNLTNTTTTANVTNITNVTNVTNVTNITQPIDNETNTTFLDGLYDYLASLVNALFDAWKPIIDTLLNGFLRIVNALEELVRLFEEFLMELQSLTDALEEILKMLELIWNELDGILKLLGLILNVLEQILSLIQYIVDLILQLISAIISLIQQILGWLFGLIDAIIDLINQIISLIQAILDLLKSVGSFLISVIENAAIIITAFIIITVGAFVYNRIR